jgi:hypothetical protein
MLSAAETVCANSALIGCRVEAPPLWAADTFEVVETVQIRLRAVAWGLALSSVLWASLFLAGRALWTLWR